MSAPTNISQKSKAYLSSEHHQVFVELCVEQVQKGNRPMHYFNRAGWDAIMKGFTQRTGLHYNRKQMKNRYDSTKESWKVWKCLREKSGLGFDPILRTVDAPYEAWASYIKANPKAAQFRNKPLEFDEQLDVIFGGTTSSGGTSWAPSCGVLHNENVDITQDSHDTFSTCQTSEDTLSFHSMTNHEVELDEDDTRSNTFSKKQSIDPIPSSSRKSKREVRGVVAKMTNQIDRLIEAIATKQLRSQESMGISETCTVIDCIKRLEAMDEVDPESDLYFYAIELFHEEYYRMTFMGIERSTSRFKWLKRLYAATHPSE